MTLEVRRPDRWRRFTGALLGDRARIVWDDSARRAALRVTQGPRDDLSVLGLALPDEEAFRETLDRLTIAAVAWDSVAPPPGAREAVRCSDPAGNVVELLLLDGEKRSDPAWPVGHVALAHHDPAAMEDFYVRQVGFRCNQRMQMKVGPIDLRGTFLGSAVRHHTVAVLSVPSLRRIHHVMIGAADVADVVEARDRARRAGISLSMELGRHGAPDGTTSIYAASPSSFDVEVGAGGNLLDGRDLAEVPLSNAPSSWGHEVSVRARLRVAHALAVRGLGLAG